MGKIITALPTADPIDLDNDYIPVRQTQATGEKTRRMPLRRVTESLQTSINTVSANVQTAQDAADAAIPLTQKGAANGVATLDASSKIPAAQLNLTGLSFKGYWNATNNIPAIIDGTGTAGDYYIIQVDSGNEFNRNLGLGAVDWSKDGYALYDGAKWIENEATGRVVSVNGLDGPVVLDADNISSTATNEYVTPDQKAALDGALNGLSALNPVISRAALDSAILASSVVVIGDILTPQTFSDGNNDCDNGENTLLSSAGYTNNTAETQWPLAAAAWGAIDASTTSFADVQWQSVLWSLKSGINYTVQSLPNKAYAFNRCGIIIPNGKDSPSNFTDSQHYEINFSNCLYYNRSGIPKVLFLKEPATQTEADTVIDNQWTFMNSKFRGPGGVGDVGMKVGAMRGCRFQFLEFQNFQYGLQGAFLLNSRFEEVNTISCSTAGIYIDKGWWSGATYANAGSQPKFFNCRQRMTSATSTGLRLIGIDSGGAYGCTGEGTAAGYGIYVANSTSTVSKNFEIRVYHAEIGGVAQFTNAVIGTQLRDFHTFTLDKIYSQSGVADTVLLEALNTQGTNIYELTNCRGNTGAGRWKIKNTNGGGAGAYIFRNYEFRGNGGSPTELFPLTADDVVNVATFPNNWTADSDVPPAGRILMEKSLR